MAEKCRVYWLGRQGYEEAWKLQKDLAEKRVAGDIPDVLLLLEHPPTITLGRGADVSHVLADDATLEREKVVVVESNRGGDVTYHGPGQLVGYPILNLQAEPHRPDLHLYLRNIEAALIECLASFGITANRRIGYTGVWTGLDMPSPEKVAAIGIRVSKWITQHGFALNVDPDMSHFELIVPCGIREFGVTSMSRLLGRPVNVEEAIGPTAAGFADVFDLECTLDYGLPPCGII